MGGASSPPTSRRGSAPATRWTRCARCAGAFRAARFVFVIGADNLAQLPRWQGWRGMAGDGAHRRAAAAGLDAARARGTGGAGAGAAPPAARRVARTARRHAACRLGLVPAGEHAASATAIRAAGGILVSIGCQRFAARLAATRRRSHRPHPEDPWPGREQEQRRPTPDPRHGRAAPNRARDGTSRRRRAARACRAEARHGSVRRRLCEPDGQAGRQARAARRDTDARIGGLLRRQDARATRRGDIGHPQPARRGAAGVP